MIRMMTYLEVKMRLQRTAGDVFGWEEGEGENDGGGRCCLCSGWAAGIYVGTWASVAAERELEGGQHKKKPALRY